MQGLFPVVPNNKNFKTVDEIKFLPQSRLYKFIKPYIPFKQSSTKYY